MQTVYTVIRDCGDGSQAVEWRKLMNDAIVKKLESINYYQSGDGVQIRTYYFPNNFNLDEWAEFNHITWYDGNENEIEE